MRDYGTVSLDPKQMVVQKSGATNGGNGQDSGKSVGGTGYANCVVGKDSPIVAKGGAVNNGDKED